MDSNLNFVVTEKVNRTIKNLKKNNMDAYFVNDENELLVKLNELLQEGWLISVGGSQSLFETKVIDYLKSGRFEYLDRYKDGLNPKEIKEVFRKSFYADAYITGTNAILESGELYNVDGNGNRVAAMLYGPDKVIVIAGVNKIVKDLEHAEERVKAIAGPANCIRLNKKTPCTKVGYCMDCQSEHRICNDYVLIKRQNVSDRITVLIVGKDLGY